MAGPHVYCALLSSEEDIRRLVAGFPWNAEPPADGRGAPEAVSARAGGARGLLAEGEGEDALARRRAISA